MTGNNERFVKPHGTEQDFESNQLKNNELEADLLMEAFLARRGLLDELEASGQLPSVYDPNPHKEHMQRKAYNRWWQENPEEAIKFQNSIQQRNQALEHIYVGYQLRNTE